MSDRIMKLLTELTGDTEQIAHEAFVAIGDLYAERAEHAKEEQKWLDILRAANKEADRQQDRAMKVESERAAHAKEIADLELKLQECLIKSIQTNHDIADLQRELRERRITRPTWTS